MFLHFRRSGALLAGACLCAAAPLRAQFNLGAAAGAVRYEGVPGTNSFALNSDLTLRRPRLLWNLEGIATTATDGSRSLEGGTTLWGATRPVAKHLQFDGMLQGVYMSPAGDSNSYSLLVFGEAAFAGDDYGVGIGGGVLRGGITGQPAINALRARARVWTKFGPWAVALSVQPTALSTTVWFTDVAGTAEIDPGNTELLGTLLMRQSPGTGLDLGFEGSLTYHITPRVAFVASGGRYLRDPFQGLPKGLHANIGVVLRVSGREAEDSVGAGKADLTDVSLKDLGIIPNGFWQSGLRINPANSAGGGRGYKP